jgi:hypothetical protein
MDKLEIIEIKSIATDELIEHALITHEDGSFTSMLKTTYDEQLKANEATTI